MQSGDPDLCYCDTSLPVYVSIAHLVFFGTSGAGWWARRRVLPRFECCRWHRQKLWTGPQRKDTKPKALMDFPPVTYRKNIYILKAFRFLYVHSMRAMFSKFSRSLLHAFDLRIHAAQLGPLDVLFNAVKCIKIGFLPFQRNRFQTFMIYIMNLKTKFNLEIDTFTRWQTRSNSLIKQHTKKCNTSKCNIVTIHFVRCRHWIENDLQNFGRSVPCQRWFPRCVALTTFAAKRPRTGMRLWMWTEAQTSSWGARGIRRGGGGAQASCWCYVQKLHCTDAKS